MPVTRFEQLAVWVCNIRSGVLHWHHVLAPPPCPPGFLRAFALLSPLLPAQLLRLLDRALACLLALVPEEGRTETQQVSDEVTVGD